MKVCIESLVLNPKSQQKHSVNFDETCDTDQKVALDLFCYNFSYFRHVYSICIRQKMNSL